MPFLKGVGERCLGIKVSDGVQKVTVKSDCDYTANITGVGNDNIYEKSKAFSLQPSPRLIQKIMHSGIEVQEGAMA